MEIKAKGLRILITGATGFIASHIVKKLLQKEAHIFVPYIDLDKRSYLAVEGLTKKVVLERLNITNKNGIFRYIKKNKIDFIFHLAAQTTVTQAYKDPYETLKTNVIGTINLLEYVRSSSHVKGIIVASSDKAYGKTKSTYKEDSPLRGDHPYDVSKTAADYISQAYYKTYNLPVVITRFGNAYGEGDLHFDRIIPGLCKAILKKEPLLIRSDGTFVRDYIYVGDVANGYLTLFSRFRGICGEAYNFSSKDTLSVLELIKKAEKILGIAVPYIIVNNAKNEIPYQHLNDTKIKKLGWRNTYSLTTTLQQILNWYRKII